MTARTRRPPAAEVRHRCRDCAHSYDWHDRAIDGHLILCRCPYKQQGGKYSIFLSDYTCEKFKLRSTHGQEAAE